MKLGFAVKNQYQGLIKIRFLKVFILIFFILIFFKCKLNKKFNRDDFPGLYVSGLLKKDTLYIIKINNDLYYFRKSKDFNKMGCIDTNIDIGDNDLSMVPWQCNGEADSNFVEGNFDATFEIIDDTIYLFQIDFNGDIIDKDKFYYKKISNIVDKEIKKVIYENKNNIDKEREDWYSKITDF